MGWQQKQNSSNRHKKLYCPFNKFCIFLGGNSPESILAERDYLSGRVDELEFAMDFSNRQVIQLQERIKELESDKSLLESEDGRVIVSCFIHCFYWCSNCRKIVHGWGEKEMPNAFIGPEARALATFLRHEIKVSYDDTQRVLQHFCGLSIVPGSIVGFDRKCFQKGEPLYKALKATLPETKYIHVDETGWKRDWLWIFTNPDIAFFHIDEHRSSAVVREHLGDFYSAYRNLVPAFGKQKCCTHLLRDIKKLLDNELPEDPDVEVFLDALKQLIKDAICFHAQHSILTEEEWRSGKKEILQRFRKLYNSKPQAP